MKAILVTLLFSCFGFADNLLDGKSFTGDIVHGKDKEKDTLVFKEGKFHSTSCDKYDYKDAAYKAAKKGELIAFEAETANDSGDKIQWKGTVKGTTVEAKGVRTNGSEKMGEMTFKGKSN